MPHVEPGAGVGLGVECDWREVAFVVFAQVAGLEASGALFLTVPNDRRVARLRSRDARSGSGGRRMGTTLAGLLVILSAL